MVEFNPDGSGMRVYAYGLRNAVGIATQPETGQLWASTNERDGLGETCRRTTSLMCRKAVFMAGPGTTRWPPGPEA